MKAIKILMATTSLFLATSFTSVAQERIKINSDREYANEINNAINTWWNTPRKLRGVNDVASNVWNLFEDPAPPMPDVRYKTVTIIPADNAGFKWVITRIYHEYTFLGWRKRTWRTWSWKVPCGGGGEGGRGGGILSTTIK